MTIFSDILESKIFSLFKYYKNRIEDEIFIFNLANPLISCSTFFSSVSKKECPLIFDVEKFQHVL